MSAGKLGAVSLLREAADTIEQRGKLRDSPEGERSMATAVALFSLMTGNTLSEVDGWKFMLALKLARSRQGLDHIDDYLDLAGYAALTAEAICAGPVTGHG